jgi:hypothetical protein
MNNKIFRLLCSIPVILLVLYFIPFLGVCLMVFRLFIYRNEKGLKMPITLVITGFILLIPSILNSILKTFKINIEIPYLNEVLSYELYPNIVKYSKLLITLGIIFIMVSYLVSKLLNRVESKVEEFIEEEHDRNQENDLKIKEKQERAKKTRVVKCPYCGASTMLTEDTGVCKFCRKPIS